MRLKKFFYVFLDISGILLGIYLTILGFWLASGRSVNLFTGILTLVVGVGAFLLHLGHYFELSYFKWLFGEKYFLSKNGQREKE